MDDKQKTILVVFFAISFLVGLVIQAVGLWMEGEILLTSVMFIILAISVAVLIWFLKKEMRRMKEKLPREDEMSERVKQRAGYYAFWASFYMVCWLMWYNALGPKFLGLPKIGAEDIFYVILVTMLGFIFLFWLYFNRRVVE